jgi:RING finger/CHY zinc finger protein 1
MESSSSSNSSSSSSSSSSSNSSPYTGCEHYRVAVQLLAPCCGQFFPCRFCHDAIHDTQEKDPKKAHTMDRKAVTTVRCMHCEEIQKSQRTCQKCDKKLGEAYYCPHCNLFDDVDKGQFHCAGCGICRVGGEANYTHCEKCCMCVPTASIASHVCLGTTKTNCAVCASDLHSSTTPVQFLKCGHSMHGTCLREMLLPSSTCLRNGGH